MKKLKLMALLSLVALASIVMVACNGNGWLKPLDSAVETQIRQDYFNQVVSPTNNEASLGDVQIYKYYGSFNGYVAIMFNDGARQSLGQEIVAGVTINYRDSRRISVWNAGNFYSLQEAYDSGFISIEVLEQIHSLHTAKWYLSGTKSHGIDFTIGHNNMNINTGFSQDLKSIVNTFAEWDILRGDTAQFTELDAKYTEQFFATNSLIVYAFTRNVGGSQTEITKVSKNGNELVVEATDDNMGYMDVITNGIIIIEVNKADIAGVRGLRIVLTTN